MTRPIQTIQQQMFNNINQQRIMTKKRYMKPQTTAMQIETAQMIANSGFGVNACGTYEEGVNVDLSKKNTGDVWGLDDEE